MRMFFAEKDGLRANTMVKAVVGTWPDEQHWEAQRDGSGGRRSCGEVTRRGEVHLYAVVCRFSADTLFRQTMTAMRQARTAFEGGMPVWSVTLSVA